MTEEREVGEGAQEEPEQGEKTKTEGGAAASQPPQRATKRGEAPCHACQPQSAGDHDA